MALGSFTRFGGSKEHIPVVYTHLWEFKDWIRAELSAVGIEVAEWEGPADAELVLDADERRHDEF